MESKYPVTGKYQFNPMASTEIAKHVQDVLLPLLRQTPGLVATYWVGNSAEGQDISPHVFEGPSGADELVRVAGEYVKEHWATVPGTPEITK